MFYTAGFITWVVLTPTEHEFLWAVGKWRCGARGRFQIDFQFCSVGSYWLMMVLFDGSSTCAIPPPSTACNNSCLLWIRTTRVTKISVSRLPSEIQCSLRACSIGNGPQNMLVFSFFQFMHCVPVQCVGSVTLCHPLYILPFHLFSCDDVKIFVRIVLVFEAIEQLLFFRNKQKFFEKNVYFSH